MVDSKDLRGRTAANIAEEWFRAILVPLARHGCSRIGIAMSICRNPDAQIIQYAQIH